MGLFLSAGIAIEMTRWEKSWTLIVDVMIIVRVSFKGYAESNNKSKRIDSKSFDG